MSENVQLLGSSQDMRVQFPPVPAVPPAAASTAPAAPCTHAAPNLKPQAGSSMHSRTASCRIEPAAGTSSSGSTPLRYELASDVCADVCADVRGRVDAARQDLCSPFGQVMHGWEAEHEQHGA